MFRLILQSQLDTKKSQRRSRNQIMTNSKKNAWNFETKRFRKKKMSRNLYTAYVASQLTVMIFNNSFSTITISRMMNKNLRKARKSRKMFKDDWKALERSKKNFSRSRNFVFCSCFFFSVRHALTKNLIEKKRNFLSELVFKMWRQDDTVRRPKVRQRVLFKWIMILGSFRHWLFWGHAGLSKIFWKVLEVAKKIYCCQAWTCGFVFDFLQIFSQISFFKNVIENFLKKSSLKCNVALSYQACFDVINEPSLIVHLIYYHHRIS